MCINDILEWNIDFDLAGTTYFLDHPEDLGYLGRVYVGFLGRKAEAVPRDLGDVDIFFVAPDPPWALTTLAADINHVMGLQAHVYVFLEKWVYDEHLNNALSSLPGLEHEEVYRGFGSDFDSPVVLQSERLATAIKLSSVHLVDESAVVLHAQRKRGPGCNK